MGVRVLRASYSYTSTVDLAVLYCSTTDWAFGPLFFEGEDKKHDAYERAEAFLRWLPKDAREYEDTELESLYSKWLSQEEDQWKRETQVEEDSDMT